MGHIVEDRYLRAALARGAGGRAAGRASAPAAGSSAQAAAPGGVAVTLADGTELRGTAAGRLRRARQRGVARRAGIGRRGLGLRADLAGLPRCAHARPHGGIAHQFFMPSGPLAILPLPGNRSSIVWTEAARAGRGDRGAGRRGLPRRAAPAVRRLPRRDRARRRRAAPIRSACRWPSGWSARAWRWPGTRRTASIRWRGRA